MSEKEGNQDVAVVDKLSTTVTTLDKKSIVNSANKAIYYLTNNEVKIGSRKVRIERVDKWALLPRNDPNAKGLRDEVVQKIGSEWKKGTRDIIRGINRAEEGEFVSRLIGSKPTSPDWDKQLIEFWANFTIFIPTEDGVTLETGFKVIKDYNNDEKVYPINVDDYIKYCFARESSLVAPEGNDNTKYNFRIADLASKEENNQAEFTLRMQTDAIMAKLHEQADKLEGTNNKIDWILETVGGPKGVGMAIHGLTTVQKLMELEKVKDAGLAKFKAIVEDPQIETKALIRKGVFFQRINHEGNSFYINNKLIGVGIDQAVRWINDPNNAGEKIMLVEAVRDYKKESE